MGRTGRPWLWRGLGGVAVLWLAGSLAVLWLLFGARLGALTGITGPTGTFAVADCHGGLEQTATQCRGTYTPYSVPSTRGGPAARAARLHSPADEHRPGTRRHVRLVGGRAFEPSPFAAAENVTFAVWAAATLGLPGHWLLASVRRGRLRDGDGYVFAWFGSFVGGIALGILSLPVAWLLATVRG
ncbi:hypothetical protein [Streptomyces sp. NPDC057939]|uniref:hypothetical protein n=1 Tax=Streptomyces sp. NPDC057939 TaxID=3346284 RepID=UPI0036E3D6F5